MPPSHQLPASRCFGSLAIRQQSQPFNHTTSHAPLQPQTSANSPIEQRPEQRALRPAPSPGGFVACVEERAAPSARALACRRSSLMSVQAISPFSGSKRLFEEHSEDIDSSCDRGQGKRGRFVAGSPSSGRCSGPGPSFQAVHPATIQALKGLFPGMDDQVRLRVPSAGRARARLVAPQQHTGGSTRAPCALPQRERPTSPCTHEPSRVLQPSGKPLTVCPCYCEESGTSDQPPVSLTEHLPLSPTPLILLLCPPRRCAGGHCGAGRVRQ